jgi:hypothetical protein
MAFFTNQVLRKGAKIIIPAFNADGCLAWAYEAGNVFGFTRVKRQASRI